MSRPDGQDTRSDMLGSASTGSLVRGGYIPDVDTGAGPVDADIDDDNRSRTTGSLPGTARAYKSALMEGLDGQGDSGMGAGDERDYLAVVRRVCGYGLLRGRNLFILMRAREADHEPERGD